MRERGYVGKNALVFHHLNWVWYMQLVALFKRVKRQSENTITNPIGQIAVEIVCTVNSLVSDGNISQS